MVHLSVVAMMDAVCPVVTGTGAGGVGSGGSSGGGGPTHFVVPEDMQHLGIAPIGDPHHGSFVNTLIYSQVGDRQVRFRFAFDKNRRALNR